MTLDTFDNPFEQQAQKRSWLAYGAGVLLLLLDTPSGVRS